ncbi:MAG: DNA polymerase III subunit delta [Henriciella sp.]|jgi:DNA polymerase-3 subunit delta|nr:DNA polymerase III subunit delta [Henriciella sp.]
MKYKGNGAERFAKKPDPACQLALIFGDDEGVVADTANTLIKSWEAAGPSNVITLDDDEIKREPSTLFDALEAVSLLGEASIIRIRTKGEKLFALLKDVLAMPPERLAAKVVVQNGSLNTRSKMRTAFEAGANTAALHLFSDNDTDMAELVRGFLKTNSAEIEADALSFFVGGLPGHRSLANAEMEKLAVYAHDLGRAIEVADIQALCETNADESARSAVLLALEGKPQAAQLEMDRVLDAGLSPISLLRLFEMEASRMIAAQALQGESGGGNVGMKLKPPVWQSDWPAFQARMKKWPTPRLVRLIERLHDMELLAKSPGGAGMAEAATRELFISFYKAAAAIPAR